MFIRKVKYRSGSQSVQVIQKFRDNYKVVKTIGCATTQHLIEKLEQLTREEVEHLSGNQRNRIEAHICIAFEAYWILKELERVLREEKSSMSLKRSSELTRNMYHITYTLPKSKQTKSKLLNMDEEQSELYQIICKNFQGVAMRKTGKVYLIENRVKVCCFLLVFPSFIANLM